MRGLIAALVAAPFLLTDVGVKTTMNSSGHRLPHVAIALSKSEAETAPFDRARFDFDRTATMLAALPAIPDVAASELLFATPLRGAFATPEDADAARKPAISTDEFCDALAAAAQANNIPVSFFARLIWQESQFKADEVSPVGAQGVAQFMPDTAAEEGLDDPFDPLKALPASARLLRKLRDRLGNLGLAAAAYNAGTGRIQDWVARRAALPAETRNYVQRITGNPAENWIREAKTIGVPQQLPREAPCAGVGGLSRGKAQVATEVSLAPDLRSTLQRVRLAEAKAARARAAKAHQHGAVRLASARRSHRVRYAAADR